MSLRPSSTMNISLYNDKQNSTRRSSNFPTTRRTFVAEDASGTSTSTSSSISNDTPNRTISRKKRLHDLASMVNSRVPEVDTNQGANDLLMTAATALASFSGQRRDKATLISSDDASPPPRNKPFLLPYYHHSRPTSTTYETDEKYHGSMLSTRPDDCLTNIPKGHKQKAKRFPVKVSG